MELLCLPECCLLLRHFRPKGIKLAGKELQTPPVLIPPVLIRQAAGRVYNIRNMSTEDAGRKGLVLFTLWSPPIFDLHWLNWDEQTFSSTANNKFRK